MPFHIETQEIRVFKAVVEENGFKRAADKLFVTQSAVSQTIASLERKTDTLLLVRNPLKLTEAGIRMLNYAQVVLSEESQTLSDIRNIKHGIHATLLLAMSSTVNYLYGTSLICHYCQQSPLTKIKLNVMPSRQIYASMASDTCELGFGPFQQVMPNHLTATAMFTDQRELVISGDHPAFKNIAPDPETPDAPTPAMLTEVPLIISHLDDPDLRPAMDRLRDSFGTIWEINDLSLRIDMVAQGLGMTYLDKRIRQQDARCTDFKVLEFPSFSTMPLSFGVFFRRGKPLSSGASAFIELCGAFNFGAPPSPT